MKFLESESGHVMTFTEAFLNGEILTGKSLKAVDVPRLPSAFIKNLGEMTASDVAFVVASQFFGERIDAINLQAITFKWLDSFKYINEMEGEPDETIDFTISLDNLLIQYYISQKILRNDTTVIGYGSGIEINSYLKYLVVDKLLFAPLSHVGDITVPHDFISIVYIKGSQTDDERLIAKAVHQLKTEGVRSLVMLTPKNVTGLLTFVFKILNGARILSANGNSIDSLRVYCNPDDNVQKEAISIASALGLNIVTTNIFDDASTIKLSCNNFKSQNPITYHNHIATIAPTVPVIKQTILSYTTK